MVTTHLKDHLEDPEDPSDLHLDAREGLGGHGIREKREGLRTYLCRGV
jgi:hypothetical protein